jgi:glycosyltransferase involved in cell wall biosynthesis
MAAGVPVVASDVGACREVLDEGDLGILVPGRDPEALAEAIERVRCQRGEALIRAERAREKVAVAYDIEQMAQRYGELLGLAAAG